MFDKKRLELMIEKPAFKRACRVLEEAGVQAYSAFAAMAGYGNGRRWQKGTDLSATQDMVMIIAVMDEAIVEKAIDNLENLIGAHIGLLSITDTKVIRDEKF